MKFKTLAQMGLIAGLSLAATAFGGAATPAATAPAATAKTAAVAAPKAMSFSGMVVSTDAIGNTVVVKGSKGEETFSVPATCTITQGKKDVKLADVAKDQKVTVKYMEEAGAKTASSIKVTAAKKAVAATAAVPAK